jgi:phospholipase D1/2
MPLRTITRLATVALGLLLLALAWGFTPLSGLANPDTVAAAMTTISSSSWRVAIVFGCYLGAGLVFFPVLLLMIACAAVFGPLAGIAYSTAGLLASASLNYCIGAWLGRETVRSVLGHHLGFVRTTLMRRGLIAVAVVRAIPMSPFALISLAAGTSEIRFLDYFIGTAMGVMVPVVIMSVATEQTLRMLREPTGVDFAVLAGLIVLWIAIAFAAQALLQRIARGQAHER